MSLTAAASGFLVLLLTLPVVQGQIPVGTYSSTDICASRGSTVNMSCTFSHESSLTIKKTCWYPEGRFDRNCDSGFIDRATYFCDDKNKCTLRIEDLKDSDAKTYTFRIVGEGRGNTWSFPPGVKLTVTALQMHVTRVKVNVSHTEAELSCTSTCTRPSYVWFKNGLKVPEEEAASYTGHLEPGDGISCALKGHEDHRVPSLYAPKFPSVSVSPSGEVMEDSSVTLTCSSDANIVAHYTWYKRNETEPLSKEPQLVFNSIQSSDSGQYYCTAENQLGTRETQICIDVKYGPKRPSMSVSLSAEIVEGSSLTLTCSSDANPAANYTWYKEDEDSPKASGQIFIITDVRAEHSGSYYCEAQNNRGRSNSTLTTLTLTVVSVLDKTAMIIRITRLTLVVVIPISLLLFCLWMRKKKAQSSTTEPHEPIETVEAVLSDRTHQRLDSDPQYENNSNTAAQAEDSEEQEDQV
ncbi:hypothetical protein VZT92_003279 [Zoarces viviparus]|uniref:Ig-like domain-containing protein n=1 Tax=Zoarces viviparus TaxID=48416 RepID=A0AAW1G0Q4_ZOAVI